MRPRDESRRRSHQALPKAATRRLPPIVVDEPTTRIRLDVPERLHQDLELYARYFAAASGRKPRSMTDVILAVVDDYFGTDAGFINWKQAHPQIDATDSPFAMRAEAKSSGQESA